MWHRKDLPASGKLGLSAGTRAFSLLTPPTGFLCGNIGKLQTRDLKENTLQGCAILVRPKFTRKNIIQLIKMELNAYNVNYAYYLA